MDTTETTEKGSTSRYCSAFESKLEKLIGEAPEAPGGYAVNADLREQAAREWEEAVRDKAKDRLREKGFPRRHIEALDSMHGPGLARAEELKARVEGRDCLLVLCGDRGPGKTQIATFWGLGFKYPRYYKAHGLIRTIRGQFSQDQEEREFARNTLVHASTCDYLVIDEFSELAGSEFEKRELTHLVDERYDAMKSTVIITNAPKHKVAEQIERSILSRVSEVGGIVECNWPSYRA